MKVSNWTKQDSLKALLVFIVALNFLGSLNDHKGSATLYTTGDSEVKGNSGAPLTATPPPTTPPPPAAKTAAQIAKEASDMAKKGSPLGSEADAAPAPAPMPGPAQPSEEPHHVYCSVDDVDHAYDYVYAVAGDSPSQMHSTLYAFAPGDKDRKYYKALVNLAGDANLDKVKYEIKQKMDDKLGALSENQDCQATANDNRAVGVTTCENDAAGDTLSEIAGMLCADNRVSQSPLKDGDGHVLAHKDLIEELRRMTDMMEDGLRSMAERECSEEKGDAYNVCSNGKKIDYVNKAQRALTHWVNSSKLDSREKDAVRKMIADIKGLNVADKGKKKADELDKKAQDLKDDIAKDLQHEKEDCKAGPNFDFIECANDKQQWASDKQALVDLYSETREATDYQSLLDLKKDMDYPEWAELTHDVRDPFMKVLQDISTADPGYSGWRKLLTSDIQSLNQMAARSSRGMGDGAPDSTDADGNPILGDRSNINQRGTIPANILAAIGTAQLTSLQQLNNLTTANGMRGGPQVSLAAGGAINPNQAFFGTGGNGPTAGPGFQGVGSPMAANFSSTGGVGFGSRMFAPQGNGTVFGGAPQGLAGGFNSGSSWNSSSTPFSASLAPSTAFPSR